MQYWYIYLVIALISVVAVIALSIALSRVVKQLKENAEVAKGRMQDMEREKLRSVQQEQAKNATEQKEIAKEQDSEEGEDQAAITEVEEEEVPEISQKTADLSEENTEDDMKKEVKTENCESAEVKGKETKAIYRVIYDKENKEWMVKKDGATRVIRRVRTKAEALELATQFAENQDLSLSVQKKDGKFQKKSNYTKMVSSDKEDKNK